jgi:hypothetical protein
VVDLNLPLLAISALVHEELNSDSQRPVLEFILLLVEPNVLLESQEEKSVDGPFLREIS